MTTKSASAGRKPVVLLTVPKGIEGKGGVERLMKGILESPLSRDFTFIPFETVGENPSIIRRSARMARQFAAFLLLLSAKKPDLVHVNICTHGSAYRKAAYVTAASARDVRTLVHIHGAGFDEFYRAQPRSGRAFLKSAFRKASLVVVLGDFWRGFAVEEGLGEEAQLAILRNATTDNVGRAAAIDERTHDRSEPVIAFAGEVGARKGIEDLLIALSSDANKARSWRLRVAGNGAIEEMTARAKALGIGERVEFLGWVTSEDVRALYMSADIMTLPSYAENQPISIIEALAAGLPVISTRIAAIDEQVEDGTNGYLVTPGDTDALGNLLGNLVDDAQLREAMGRASRDKFERQFEWNRFLEELAALYAGTVANKDVRL